MQMAHRNVHGGAKPPYNSGITCLQHLLRTEGLRGLTRGVGATAARETPGNAIFFTVYELLRRIIPGRPPSAARSQARLQFSFAGRDRPFPSILSSAKQKGQAMLPAAPVSIYQSANFILSVTAHRLMHGTGGTSMEVPEGVLV